MLNINELSSRIGFSVVFIRKCLEKLGDILAPYTQRGEFNRILFTSNAVVIFDKIKQLKDDGLSLPEIRRSLEKDLRTNRKTGGEDSEQTPDKSDKNSDTFSQLIELYQRVNDEKEKRIKDRDEATQRILDLEKQNQQLTLTLKLLPEGKSPEELKQAWEEEQKRKREMALVIGELKNLGILRFRKRKMLLQRLEDLTP
jgi:hypothetical protein